MQKKKNKTKRKHPSKHLCDNNEDYEYNVIDNGDGVRKSYAQRTSEIAGHNKYALKITMKSM